MTDTDFKEVAQFQFESAQARLERIISRLWILCLLLIVLLVGTNGAWIYYESQFQIEEKTIITQEIDAESGNAFLVDGVHIGENKANSN